MRIYIDGVKTRQNIAEETGKKSGVKQLCDELGVSTNLVNKYIRQGYGDGGVIIDMIRKGIPFELSREAVPCRAKTEHTRGKKSEKVQMNAEEPLQIPIEEMIMQSGTIPDVDLRKVEFQILQELKKACYSIIRNIESIQQCRIYESIFGETIFGGEENE